jgi:hypothetical protein
MEIKENEKEEGRSYANTISKHKCSQDIGGEVQRNV